MRVRLSVMMFLQFFVWGSWFVTLGTFLASNLHAAGGQIAAAFATQSWGAIIAPFVVGLIADRYFNAERVLGLLHLVGGVLMYRMYVAADFGGFYPYVLGYMILYMPTLALVNSVAFRQLEDPARQFSSLRVWGTIGWIVAGLAISLVFAWDSAAAVAAGALGKTLYMGAVVSWLLGLYSFTLPATPALPATARSSGAGAILGLDAFKLLRDRNFLVFFLASILICIPLAFYYQNANQFLVEIHVSNATAKQTIGQMSEVLFMLLIPVFLLRFGMKTTLLVGMAAWSLRYVLFAFGNADARSWMLLLGLALHGVCYDFFFVSGQIYTESKAGVRYKSAAQGLITLATYGIGMLIGFWAAGAIADVYSVNGMHDWSVIWLYPAAFAAAVLVLFVVSFRNETVGTRRD